MLDCLPGLFFGQATWHVGLYFLDQESNMYPLHWKGGVLSTGLPGQSFTWILDQELSKILSASFPMVKDHSQYRRCLKPGWIISPNLLIPQMRKPRPWWLVLAAHTPFPSWRVCTGSAQKHVPWPRPTPSPASLGTKNRDAWVGVEAGSLALLCRHGFTILPTKERRNELLTFCGLRALKHQVYKTRASQEVLVVKNSPDNAGDMRHGFAPWVRKIPWRREWLPTPVFLPGESMDRGTLKATQSMGSQRSQTWFSNLACIKQTPFVKYSLIFLLKKKTLQDRHCYQPNLLISTESLGATSSAHCKETWCLA